MVGVARIELATPAMSRRWAVVILLFRINSIAIWPGAPVQNLPNSFIGSVLSRNGRPVMTISVAKIVNVGQGFQLGGKAEPWWAEGSGVYHHFRRRAAHGPNIVRFKGCEGTIMP